VAAQAGLRDSQEDKPIPKIHSTKAGLALHRNRDLEERLWQAFGVLLFISVADLPSEKAPCRSEPVPLTVCSHSLKTMFVLPAFPLLRAIDTQLYTKLYVCTAIQLHVSDNTFGRWQHLKQTS